MSLRATLVDAFIIEPTISAIVGDRVFDIFYDFEDLLNSRANLVSKFPAITIESEGNENEENLDAHDNLNRETFTITCYQQVNLSKLRSRSSSVRNKERDILRQIDTLGDAVNAFIKDKREVIDTYNIRSSHISSDTDDVFETEDNREIITRVLTYNVGWSTTEVIPPSIPINSIPPLVSGDTEEGSIITTTNGTWTQSPILFTYRWLRDGSPIAGETSITYTSQAADVGFAVTSEVTAINGTGSSLPEVSSNSIIVTSSAIQRNFTTLDEAFSMHYLMPSLTTQIGDVIKITFLAPNSAVALSEYILDGTADRHYLLITSGGTFNIEPDLVTGGNILLDGVSVASNSAYPTDGKFHTIETTVSGTGVLTTLGARDNTGVNAYDGILSNFQIERASTLIRNYPIDETWIGPSTVLNDTSGFNQNGTAVNIDTDDSELFTFDGSVSPNTWTNIGATRIIEVAGT